MNNYLFQNNQKAKISKSNNLWDQILFGVPQGWL